MISMTFGNIPSYDVFECKFDEVCESGRFKFGNDRRVGTDEFTCTELYSEVVMATKEHDEGDEVAGYWVSAVLGILDIEWI